MMTSFKIGKDRTTGKAISIEVASRGLSCDCVCFDCGKVLVAAKGEKNDWHFRHYEETTCTGGQETALHKKGKEIIENGTEIVLMKYGKVEYNNAKQEIPFLAIIPDVSALLKPSGQNFFFEILVTHAVDTNKRKMYESGEHKSVEIILKDYSFTTDEKLRQDILYNGDYNETIFWEREVMIEQSNDNGLLYFLLFFLTIVTFGIVKNSNKKRRR